VNLERLAERLDRLTSAEAARTLVQLDKRWHDVEPQLIDKILDLLGTKKARSIRTAMASA
jgi:uncharacterized tellurite resistance protein B-like protein